MAHLSSRYEPDSTFFLRGPWGIYLGALAFTLLGYVGLLTGVGALRGIGIVAGLIAAGSAVAWRLQRGEEGAEDRVQSAALVFLSGLLAAVDMLLLPASEKASFPASAVPDGTAGIADWGTARMFLQFLLLAGVLGAALVALPRFGRRLLVSALVLLHFGGIFTAVTAIEPPGAAAPWLSLQVWTRFYRPYLSFLYLNNAYHFYSPEPGPPTLLWFYVRYADDQAHWVKIPVREESPVPLHYQRLLALTESTNMVNAQPVFEPEFNEKLHRRRVAGNFKGIPTHPLLTPHSQYREPQLYSKVMLSSYARFAARHFKHLTDPLVPMTSVRIYKVTHNIVLASDLARGYSPLEKTLYHPYFMGEFDPNGELVDKDDPFLYWLIPIYTEDLVPHFEPRAIGAGRPEMKIVDSLEIHKDLWSQTQPEKLLP